MKNIIIIYTFENSSTKQEIINRSVTVKLNPAKNGHSMSDFEMTLSMSVILSTFDIFLGCSLSSIPQLNKTDSIDSDGFKFKSILSLNFNTSFFFPLKYFIALGVFFGIENSFSKSMSAAGTVTDDSLDDKIISSSIALGNSISQNLVQLLT